MHHAEQENCTERPDFPALDNIVINFQPYHVIPQIENRIYLANKKINYFRHEMCTDIHQYFGHFGR